MAVGLLVVVPSLYVLSWWIRSCIIVIPGILVVGCQMAEKVVEVWE